MNGKDGKIMLTKDEELYVSFGISVMYLGATCWFFFKLYDVINDEVIVPF